MRVLVAGVGSIGQRHIRNLRTLAGAGLDLMAYRVRHQPHVLTERMTIEAGSHVNDKYALRVCHDLAEGLALRPDAVFVCNPTREHMRVALAAAHAGCHLLVEKPLSDRADGIDELIAVVKRKNLVAMVGYQMRFHPALTRVRMLLGQQAIGRVVSVHAQVGESLEAAHPYEDYRLSYAGRADLGGGVIVSQSHELDYLCWLFGLPRRVFALGGHLSRMAIDVEDTASILMECFVDGRPVPVHVALDFVQSPPTRVLQIVGDRGKIHVDFGASTLEVFAAGVSADVRRFSDCHRNQLFMDELQHFLACLKGEATPLVTLRDGARALQVALAARESIKTRRAVSLQ